MYAIKHLYAWLIDGLKMSLSWNMYTTSVFCYDEHNDIHFSIEETDVMYEPAAPAAVLNTALLCI